MFTSNFPHRNFAVKPEQFICINMLQLDPIVISCGYRICTKATNHQMNNSLYN